MKIIIAASLSCLHLVTSRTIEKDTVLSDSSYNGNSNDNTIVSMIDNKFTFIQPVVNNNNVVISNVNSGNNNIDINNFIFMSKQETAESEKSESDNCEDDQSPSSGTSPKEPTPNKWSPHYSSTYERQYCTPELDCWPNVQAWKSLNESISGHVWAINANKLDNDEVYKTCYMQSNDAYGIASSGHGACMQYHDCSKIGCQESNEWNLPEYSVEVKKLEDIVASVDFANQYNIPITVKTSGHSYVGSSNGRGSINIWMANFEVGTIVNSKTRTENENKDGGNVTKKFKPYKNSCGTKFDHTVKVGGGQRWLDVYRKVGTDHNIVGGGGLTVSAAGGWLQGGGLSALSRKYGFGVDNVLQFQVVTALGEVKIVDACQEPDLFWALRGGGGGTFGIVTSVIYKIHPIEEVDSSTISVYFEVSGAEIQTKFDLIMSAATKYLSFWIRTSVNLDNGWGGYWTGNSLILYFLGTRDQADATFIKDLENFIQNDLTEEERKLTILSITEGNSYMDINSKMRGDIFTTEKPNTDVTGDHEFYIGSRIVSREYVMENPDEFLQILSEVTATPPHAMFNYFLGGAVNNPSGDETAINPPYRQAIYQLEIFDPAARDLLREKLPRSDKFGSGYNHQAKDEPDWKNEFWGANLGRLENLKKVYDPEHRFNCYHCLGYVDANDEL